MFIAYALVTIAKHCLLTAFPMFRRYSSTFLVFMVQETSEIKQKHVKDLLSKNKWLLKLYFPRARVS